MELDEREIQTILPLLWVIPPVNDCDNIMRTNIEIKLKLELTRLTGVKDNEE